MFALTKPLFGSLFLFDIAMLKKIFLCFFVLMFLSIENAHSQTGDYAPKSSLSVLRFDAPALILLGSKHSYDVTDPQMEDIERLYKKFQPTVVLVEGGIWPNSESRHDAIHCCGEMGLVQFLAKEHAIKYDTWEGDDFEETKFILQEFNKDEVKFFYALRIAPQFLRNNSNLVAHKKMLDYLGDQGELEKIHHLLTPPRTPAQLNTMLREIDPTAGDWDQILTASVFDNLLDSPSFQKIKKIKTRVNQFREESALRKILSTISKKERVLVIVGNAHFRYIMSELMKVDM